MSHFRRSPFGPAATRPSRCARGCSSSSPPGSRRSSDGDRRALRPTSRPRASSAARRVPRCGGRATSLDGWEDAWRAFHHPVAVGRALDRAAVGARRPSQRAAVVIDPGRAFGTGAHPTTRLCVELLAASAAARLAPRRRLRLGRRSRSRPRASGSRRSSAVDNDPGRRRDDARRTPRSTASTVDGGSARRERRPAAAADLAVANVLLGAGRRASSTASRHASRSPPAISRTATAPRAGWQTSRGCELDGWAADVLVREPLRADLIGRSTV